MTSTPDVGADAAALTELAVSALGEVTDPASVGALVDAVEREPGVVDLGFDCLLPGYPGWRWTVSTARLDDAAPTVLEVELLPGDGSLLAPPWTPWAERLAEYRRTHGEADEPVDADTDDADDEVDDDESGDEPDFEGSDDEDSDDELDDEDSDDELDDEESDDELDDEDSELDDDVDDDLDDGVDVEAAAGLDEESDWHGEGH